MKSDRIRLASLAAFALAVFAGCSSEPAKPASLREQLENTMNTARTAVFEKDYDTFFSIMDKSSGDETPTKAEFEEQITIMLASDMGRQIINDMVPDLRKQTEFIKTKTDGDYAVYYAKTDLDDENYATVSAFLFKKTGDDWIVVGRSYSSTKARPDSKAAKEGLAAWEDEAEMLSVIDTDPKFQVESLLEQ